MIDQIVQECTHTPISENKIRTISLAEILKNLLSYWRKQNHRFDRMITTITITAEINFGIFKATTFLYNENVLLIWYESQVKMKRT